jgi:cell wall-associated NlpC family hydrolase
LRFSTSLPVIGIATIIALGAISISPAPAAATQPGPDVEPTPAASLPAPDGGLDPEVLAATTTSDPVQPTTESTTDTLTRKERIRLRYVRAMRIAIRQRYDRYVAGGTGPSAFDCSGLVRFAYRRAEISYRLGGGHSASAMLRWAREHDKTRQHNPKKGDVVIWGNGSHAGIWIGDGKVISALNPTQDIKITRLHALGAPFTAFIRTRP